MVEEFLIVVIIILIGYYWYNKKPAEGMYAANWMGSPGSSSVRPVEHLINPNGGSVRTRWGWL